MRQKLFPHLSEVLLLWKRKRVQLRLWESGIPRLLCFLLKSAPEQRQPLLWSRPDLSRSSEKEKSLKRVSCSFYARLSKRLKMKPDHIFKDNWHILALRITCTGEGSSQSLWSCLLLNFSCLTRVWQMQQEHEVMSVLSREEIPDLPLRKQDDVWLAHLPRNKDEGTNFFLEKVQQCRNYWLHSPAQLDRHQRCRCLWWLAQEN